MVLSILHAGQQRRQGDTDIKSNDFGCPASFIELALVIYFTYGNAHVSVLFSQIIPPSPSPTESKSLFFTSVSPFVALHVGLLVPSF